MSNNSLKEEIRPINQNASTSILCITYYKPGVTATAIS